MADDRAFAIIGLGLIGGSVARDLAALGARVLGFDTDPETLAAAIAAEVVHEAIAPDLAQLAEADVVILAIPLEAAPAVLAQARPHLRDDALITDVGSTKRSIARVVAALGLERRFVGGHPLAGDHRGGWTASRSGLFAGARVFLCPTPTTDSRLTARAEQLWSRLGATPELTSAEQHDLVVAFVSHLPQAMAYVLAETMARAGLESATLGPGGRDTLRLAASPAELWTGIALDNADALGTALAALRDRIVALESDLATHDAARVAAQFETGRRWYVGA